MLDLQAGLNVKNCKNKSKNKNKNPNKTKAHPKKAKIKKQQNETTVHCWFQDTSVCFLPQSGAGGKNNSYDWKQRGSLAFVFFVS